MLNYLTPPTQSPFPLGFTPGLIDFVDHPSHLRKMVHKDPKSPLFIDTALPTSGNKEEDPDFAYGKLKNQSSVLIP